MSKNLPIGYNPIAYMVILRNGHMIPLERWAHRQPIIWRDPRSKKERRAWEKAIRLSIRRLVKHDTWR